MTHKWTIYNLERQFDSGTVYKVTYQCSTFYGLVPGYFGQKDALTRDSIFISTDSVSDPGFIPYENLTQDIVLGWITGSIDQAAIEIIYHKVLYSSKIESILSMLEVTNIK
jgi:hypothetical protein